jgi:Mor family transcriptional regulator
MNPVTSNQNRKMLEYLEKIIGADDYKKVIAQFGGKVLYFPKRYELAQKHEQIRQEYAGGAGFHDLADKYLYTEKHIREIVRGRVKQEPAHNGFFSGLGKAITKIINRTGHSADNLV